VGGLAVPILVRDDEWGLLVSALAAVLLPLGLLALRHAAVRPATANTPDERETLLG
jgi:hypothetical protein